MQIAQIQANAKAFIKWTRIFVYSSFGWSIMRPTWATHYGGMGKIYEKCMSEIEKIDKKRMSCWWVHHNGNDGTMLKGFKKK